MQKIGYIFFRLLIIMFWAIPFPVLYLKSNFLSFVFYHLIGYRKKVVFKNLKNSFPEKSEKEIEKIAKGFYKNLSDITLESIKGFSMSRKQLLKRYKVLNPELAEKFYNQGKSVIGIGSHYCNWEWGVLCFSLQFKHKAVGLYKPLSNKPIDKYIRKTRAAWGMNLKPIYETKQVFEKYKNDAAVYFMISDQNPGNKDKAYWIDFLNQDTACLHGAENYAKRHDLPVMYGDVQRVKRGFYTVELKIIEENPKQTSETEITKNFMLELEKIIMKKPENWLWSHKRWKHKREKTN